MPNNHFSRKERQLKNHISNLDSLLNKTQGFISREINDLIFKIKELINLLKGVISLKKLKYILGSFAFLFGMNSNNLNAQSFSSPIQNPFGLTLQSNYIGNYGNNYYYSGKAQFADMDNDGDLDLLYSSPDIDTGYYSYYSQHIFIYHENVGNSVNPQFSTGVKNPFNLTSPQNFTIYGSILSHNLVDLDNDGDLDILASFTGNYPYYNYYSGGYNNYVNTVYKYFENIGNPAIPLFAAQQTNPFGLDSDTILAFADVIDIDGDGDYDLITPSAYFNPNGYIVNQPALFIENIGSQNNPQFTQPTVNQQLGITTPGYEEFRTPSFGDIDGDGDFDLISTDYFYNGYSNHGFEFYYQQNKGSSTNPLLSLEAKNPFGLSPAIEDYSTLGNSELVDLDGDGDLDIIVSAISIYGSSDDHKFHYYENNSNSTNTSNYSNNKINIYPNPATDIINIESNYYINSIEIVDNMGRLIMKKESCNKLNINGLKSGTYSIYLYTENEKIIKSFTKF